MWCRFDAYSVCSNNLMDLNNVATNDCKILICLTWIDIDTVLVTVWIYLPYVSGLFWLLRNYRPLSFSFQGSSKKNGVTSRPWLSRMLKPWILLLRSLIWWAECGGTICETNSSHLKIGGPWKRRFLLETTIFRCELLVSGRVYPIASFVDRFLVYL